MSIGTVSASETPAARHLPPAGLADAAPFSWPQVLVAYLVLAALAIGKALLTAKTTPLLDDTDDAMRMVTVHDLLGGQNWFDHLQYRLNTPFGAEIHWSHLIDAAIGGIVLLLRPLTGGAADTLAAYAWPLLLLLGLLVLSARLAHRLAGPEAVLPALILPAVSPALMPEFSPGRIDHDNVQILLALLMLWGALEAIERPRFAILAGIAAAVSLAIGIEGLPTVVCAVLALSLTWVVRPRRAAAMRNFGLSFAAGTLLALATAYPPGRWFEPACDEISIVYVAFAVGVGLVLTLLSLLPLGRGPAWQRLLAGGVLGAGLAMGLAAAFPLCRGGPYAALDPWLVGNWLGTIAEAKPVWDSFAAAPAITVGVVVPPLLGLVVIGVRIWRGEACNRGEWLVLGLFLAMAVAVMVAEIRGARLAGALALPAAGWLIAAARRHYLNGPKVRGAVALLGSWLGFAGLIIALPVMLAAAPFGSRAAAMASGPDGEACLMPSAFADLAKLPPARVMTPIDLGSHVLLFTPHSVVGAPYHRDQAGIRDTFHFLDGPIGEARQILVGRGVTLVVVCPGLPEMRGLPDAAPDSFLKLFATGKLPAWLQPVSAPGAVLKVFRVAS
jgi:hypothetical protein